MNRNVSGERERSGRADKKRIRGKRENLGVLLRSSRIRLGIRPLIKYRDFTREASPLLASERTRRKLH